MQCVPFAGDVGSLWCQRKGTLKQTGGQESQVIPQAQDLELKDAQGQVVG